MEQGNQVRMVRWLELAVAITIPLAVALIAFTTLRSEVGYLKSQVERLVNMQAELAQVRTTNDLILRELTFIRGQLTEHMGSETSR